MSTHEGAAAVVTSPVKARQIQGEGSGASELGQTGLVPMAQAPAIIAEWPKAPQKVGEKLLEHYGPPNEATPTKLFWNGVGPWSRLKLTSDEVVHHFPTPHTDFLTRTYVDYPVQADKASNLVAFDGSVIVARTAAQVAVRCDHEAYSTLTINLAPVEVFQGRRTVPDARRLHGETASAFVLSRDAPYAEGLLHDSPTQETGDPDESIIASGIAHQAKEKIKDVLGDGDPR